MVAHDLKGYTAVVHVFDPVDNAHTAAHSKIIDTAGFEKAGIALMIGAITGADGSNYLTPTMEESADTVGANFTTVAAGDLNGAYTVVNNTTTKASQTQFVGYRGSKRYIRLALTYTGTGLSAGLVSVLGLLGESHNNPPTAPAAITAS